MDPQSQVNKKRKLESKKCQISTECDHCKVYVPSGKTEAQFDCKICNISVQLIVKPLGVKADEIVRDFQENFEFEEVKTETKDEPIDVDPPPMIQVPASPEQSLAQVVPPVQAPMETNTSKPASGQVPIPKKKKADQSATKISIPNVAGVSNSVATPTIVQPVQIQQQQQSPQTQQKVQLVRSSDGKIQVRGLLPGQQLVHMPDGSLQISPEQPAVQATIPHQTQQQQQQQSPQTQQKVQLVRFSDGKIQVRGLLPGQQIGTNAEGSLQIFSPNPPGQPAVQATIPQPTVQTPVQVQTPVKLDMDKGNTVTSTTTANLSKPGSIKRSIEELTEEDKDQIIKDCCVRLISPQVLSKKYALSVQAIRTLVKDSGRVLPAKYNSNAYCQKE